jgi:hypothetical protein
VIRSPFCRPALWAGEPGWTELMLAPPSELPFSSTPTYECVTGCPPMIALANRATVVDGIAKPTPELEPAPVAVELLVSI